jgi:hypothetical protein
MVGRDSSPSLIEQLALYFCPCSPQPALLTANVQHWQKLSRKLRPRKRQCSSSLYPPTTLRTGTTTHTSSEPSSRCSCRGATQSCTPMAPSASAASCRTLQMNTQTISSKPRELGNRSRVETPSVAHSSTKNIQTNCLFLPIQCESANNILSCP